MSNEAHDGALRFEEIAEADEVASLGIHHSVGRILESMRSWLCICAERLLGLLRLPLQQGEDGSALAGGSRIRCEGQHRVVGCRGCGRLAGNK